MDVRNALKFAFLHTLTKCKSYIPWAERVYDAEQINKNVSGWLLHVCTYVGVSYACLVFGWLCDFEHFMAAVSWINIEWTSFILVLTCHMFINIPHKFGMFCLLFVICVSNMTSSTCVFATAWRIDIQAKQDLLVTALITGAMTVMEIGIAIHVNDIEKIYLSRRETDTMGDA